MRIIVDQWPPPRSSTSFPATPLTKTELFCVEAYYALRQVLPETDIGSQEIRRYLREVRGVRPPGTTTASGALRKAKVPHRKRGKPVGGRARLDALDAPFLPKLPDRRRSTVSAR